ncbi:C69 family dipeptidase [Proteus mirabilis]|uniref:C69 family dipeptidase n=1 Tax=Proteus TaxID=583 RepID=UPI0018C4586B|nr:C69 family dipeptidase [Proteus vulgaris]MBG3079163.1 C69 family dipeptidase [Proteus mirabilis]QPN89405.1 C69 family dipeptidase [Proteus vulgaris]
MSLFKKGIIALSINIALASSALACTTLLAGTEATNDGSYIIARSADSDALKAQHFVIHPAKTNQTGIYSTKEHNGVNNFTYPLPKNSLRYTTVPNWKTQLHGATGFNELGVGVSGTESIFASPQALAFDPYVEDTGITEDDIPDVLLSRAKTAREAIELLGSIIEKQGAGEGFGVAVVDKNELWYLETGTGHHWVAQKLPKDKYFATGNQGRLQFYDIKRDDVLGSKNLVEFAIEKGLYNPEKEGVFNFSKAYTRDDERDRTYNDPRVWIIQQQFNPSLKQAVDDGRNFAPLLTPEKKVSVEEAKAMLRNHFEGTEHDPYTNGLNGKEPWRPISVFRTYEAHVMQVRPELPQEIGEVTYVGLGMADLTAFVPYYSGLKAYPQHYGIGTNKADSDSIYWKYRKLQTLVMTDYPKLAPIVKKAYQEWEEKTALEQKEMEAKYLAMVKTNKVGADKMLNEFNLRVMASAELLTENLTNELFTVKTKDIQDDIFFANKSKKD